MSFKTNHSKYSHHKRSRRLSRRPAWDSSIQDQSAFKATPEEIKRRQEAYRSKNLEVVRQTLLEKKIAKARREAMGNISNAPKGNAFLREILFNEQDTYSLMEDTNRALEVAQDVFAEEARKYRGFPQVTQVESDDENNAVMSRPAPVDGLIRREREETTLLDKLSESVTRKTALNETYSASDSEDSEHETTVSPSVPPVSRVDLKRFQNLVENEVSSIAATQNSTSDQVDLIAVKTLAVKDKTGRKTAAVTKSKKKSSRNKENTTPDLHKLLSELESTIDRIGTELGLVRENDGTVGEIASYTVSLIQTLLYMTQFFPQLLKKQEDESRERKLLERNLIDATNRADMLASELFQTQEQFNLMLDEFKGIKVHQQQEIQLLKENVDRISQGRAVHIINVDQPSSNSPTINKMSPSRKKVSPNKVLRDSKENRSPIILHPSTSPTVKEHKAYKESPEQLRLQSVASSLDVEGGGDNQEEDDEMSIERRIEQLRTDHQLTLERFRKLGEELETTKPTVSWD